MGEKHRYGYRMSTLSVEWDTLIRGGWRNVYRQLRSCALREENEEKLIVGVCIPSSLHTTESPSYIQQSFLPTYNRVSFLHTTEFRGEQAGGLEALRADADKLRAAVEFGAACGAFTTTGPGAIAAQPTLQQAEEVLKTASFAS
jgi:hypothetical protein